MEIRKAVEADVPQLLPLMRELAVFEKYDQAFAITEDLLQEQGFRRSPPDYFCLVAEEAGSLVGYLVYQFVMFTYRGKPNLIIKELYVSDKYRSQGVGELLMKSVAREAKAAGCGLMKWWVAKWNTRSMKFYERLGGVIDHGWHEFQLSEKAFRDLAE